MGCSLSRAYLKPFWCLPEARSAKGEGRLPALGQVRRKDLKQNGLNASCPRGLFGAGRLVCGRIKVESTRQTPTPSVVCWGRVCFEETNETERKTPTVVLFFFLNIIYVYIYIYYISFGGEFRVLL